MYRAKFNILQVLFRALLWALLLGILVGYLFGYRYILVKGVSSEPYIPYRSLILTSPTKLYNLKIGDFITYSSNKQVLFSNQSNVTHQIVAIKYDGYFVEGEDITITIDGVDYEIKYGQVLGEDGKAVPVYEYELDENNNIKKDEDGKPIIKTDQYGNKVVKVDDNGQTIYEKDVGVSTKCNIITMQRVNNKEFKASITSSKEYKNFDQVVGRVVGYSKTLGRTIFLLMENKLILFGVFGCFVLLFIIKDQFSVDNLRIYK